MSDDREVTIDQQGHYRDEGFEQDPMAAWRDREAEVAAQDAEPDEVVWVDEDGTEYELTEDEVAELNEAAFSDEADELAEQAVEHGWEQLMEAYPALNDPETADRVVEAAQDAAVAEEAARDLPGFASYLLESSSFVAAVAKDLGMEQHLRGGDLFLKLHADAQASRLDWGGT